MVIKISGGRREDDYVLVSTNIVDDIKRFEETITMLKDNHSDDLNFFYFYLIVTLSDYDIIKVTDIFNKDDTYLIDFYIDKIIKYYESYINKGPREHLMRLYNEFKVTNDLKTSLLNFLFKLNSIEENKNLSLDVIKKKLSNQLGDNKFKQVNGFKVTPFSVELPNMSVDKDKNKFKYLCNLLSYIISVNSKYIDYFKEYSINNEHNINEIYNLTTQLNN